MPLLQTSDVVRLPLGVFPIRRCQASLNVIPILRCRLSLSVPQFDVSGFPWTSSPPVLQAFLEHHPRLSTYDSFRCNSTVSRLPSRCFLRSAVSSSLSQLRLVTLPSFPELCSSRSSFPRRASFSSS